MLSLVFRSKLSKARTSDLLRSSWSVTWRERTFLRRVIVRLFSVSRRGIENNCIVLGSFLFFRNEPATVDSSIVSWIQPFLGIMTVVSRGSRSSDHIIDPFYIFQLRLNITKLCCMGHGSIVSFVCVCFSQPILWTLLILSFVVGAPYHGGGLGSAGPCPWRGNGLMYSQWSRLNAHTRLFSCLFAGLSSRTPKVSQFSITRVGLENLIY